MPPPAYCAAILAAMAAAAAAASEVPLSSEEGVAGLTSSAGWSHLRLEDMIRDEGKCKGGIDHVM